jgi:hypothetical protein
MRITFRKTIVTLVILFFLIFSSYRIQSLDTKNEYNPVETYAIFFDQFPVEFNGSTLCSALEMKDSLLQIGWLENNISLFLGEDNITETIILEQMNLLEQTVDENDLVFIYLTAHGHTYCRDVLDFNSWFQVEFNQIGTANKVFLMESCYGGEFVMLFPEKCYAMSCVSPYEPAIAINPVDNGTWPFSESLFAGGISSHFWAKTLLDISADSSSDGVVSLDEMYSYSLPFIKDFYNKTFELFPDLAQYIESVAGYTENYPGPLVIDNLYYDLTLNATDFILNNEKYIWEEDSEVPSIAGLNTINYIDESSINVIFEISDRSDFNYYCYVDDDLKKWGSHGATGLSSLWQYTYALIIEEKHDYNVTLAVVDEWGNENIKQTLVRYVGEVEETSIEFFSYGITILILPLIIFYFRTKRRKD